MSYSEHLRNQHEKIMQIYLDHCNCTREQLETFWQMRHGWQANNTWDINSLTKLLNNHLILQNYNYMLSYLQPETCKFYSFQPIIV